ncbi:MAG: aldehyde ferredoxin oxidoreductase [Desulfobacteraceae bacterium]|nr:MAG: aldehyde ferredoxin oxidoreductase [Desulfobacteraceae bacterium]
MFNKVIEIDLNAQTYELTQISDQERELYLGGKGLGIKLLYDRLTPGVDPLGDENIIVITTGVMSGTSGPCSSRFHAVFKSPLTGIIGSASCGGPLGRQLKTCGLDGLIILGRAKVPQIVTISQEHVDFHPAGALWGQDIDQAQQLLDIKACQSLVIGSAGENRVLFANAASGHRYLGRGGIGAVMGAKHLKALVVKKGTAKVKPFDDEGFKRLKIRANAYINRNPISLLNRNFGTASNTGPVSRQRMLPVKNFQYGRHEKDHQITGEYIAQKHKTRFSTCRPCSIMCGHKGRFNDRDTQVPEYETLALLGASIGIFEPDHISLLNDFCNQKGLDTISAGGTLAWVMEAGQRGLVNTDLSFGDLEKAVSALEEIAGLKGFGKEMAKGTRWLSQKYGGQSFAIQCKGLEMAGYDPRGAWGQGLGYAVANRGACHLSSFPVAFENFLGFLNPTTVKSKHLFVKFFEDLYCAINSLGICQFTGYAFTLEPVLSRYTPRIVLRFLMQHMSLIALNLVDFSLFPAFFKAISGIDISSREFRAAGERIHVLERWMNCREGITRQDDTLPQRLMDESQKDDPDRRRVPLDQMLARYYRVRGYDMDGVPTPKLMSTLGITHGREPD